MATLHVRIPACHCCRRHVGLILISLPASSAAVCSIPPKKSRPHLKQRTLSPHKANTAIRPHATVVLPALEEGAPITTMDRIGERRGGELQHYDMMLSLRKYIVWRYPLFSKIGIKDCNCARYFHPRAPAPLYQPPPYVHKARRCQCHNDALSQRGTVKDFTGRRMKRKRKRG
mmetsp:Transcript_31535/g.67211  ORF Transcript_31535/g.67211 Transcript_31535/m.67211 type:complete len:173 (-) Transcript_31535:362-880(-)